MLPVDEEGVDSILIFIRSCLVDRKVLFLLCKISITFDYSHREKERIKPQ